MSRTEKFLLTTALLFAAFKTGVFIWAVPRGFDPTDESFLINGYKHWNLYNTFDYFKVLNLFFNTAEVSIQGYRVLRMVLEIFSAVLFALSFNSWYNFRFKKEREPPAPLWLFLFCCFLAVFQSVIFRMMSYNDVVYLLLTITWSALLFSENKRHGVVTVLVYLLSGLLTALMFFVKPPAAVVELILLVAYTISFYGVAEIEKATLALISFTAGGLLFLFFYPGLGADFSLWFENFSALTVIYRNLEYSLTYLLVEFFSEMGSYLLFFSVPTGIVVLLSHAVIKSTPSNWRWPLQLLAHILLVIVSARLAEDILALHSYHRFLHYSILLFAVLVYQWLALRFATVAHAVSAMAKKQSAHRNRTLLIILLLHFVVVGGSVTSLSELFYIFQTPALLVIIIPLYYYFSKADTKFHQGVLLWMLSGLLIASFTYFNLFHPYGLSQNLFKQNTVVPLFEEIQMDKQTAKTFQELNRTLRQEKFKSPRPVIALDYLCGIGYLTGGYSPGCLCYVPGDEKKMNFNCYYLEQIDAQTLGDTVPVLYTNAESLKLLQCITKSSKNYRYQFADSVYNAYALNAETKEMLGHASAYIKVGFLVTNTTHRKK